MPSALATSHLGVPLRLSSDYATGYLGVVKHADRRKQPYWARLPTATGRSAAAKKNKSLGSFGTAVEAAYAVALELRKKGTPPRTTLLPEKEPAPAADGAPSWVARCINLLKFDVDVMRVADQAKRAASKSDEEITSDDFDRIIADDSLDYDSIVALQDELGL